jgi:hypothetical protein
MRFASPFAAGSLAAVALLVLAPVACNNGDGSDGGADGSTESGTTAGTSGGTTAADASGGTTAPAACSGDGDCRAYPSHCDTCECLAVGAKAPDPKCAGTDVSCLIDPCIDKVAKCKDGTCVIQ